MFYFSLSVGSVSATPAGMEECSYFFSLKRVAWLGVRNNRIWSILAFKDWVGERNNSTRVGGERYPFGRGSGHYIGRSNSTCWSAQDTSWIVWKFWSRFPVCLDSRVSSGAHFDWHESHWCQVVTQPGGDTWLWGRLQGLWMSKLLLARVSFSWYHKLH